MYCIVTLYRCRPMYHRVLQGMLFLYQGNLTTNLPILRAKTRKERASRTSESVIHSLYFGLNRRRIEAIEIATITELSTFQLHYHSDRNDQVQTSLIWHCCKQSSLPHQISLSQFFGPSLCGRCTPSKFLAGIPQWRGLDPSLIILFSGGSCKLVLHKRG